MTDPTPNPPVPASTVIVLRERAGAPHALETFLLRRPGRGAFAGAHVFPGGRVDETDAHMGWPEHCDGVAGFMQRLRDHLAPEVALAHAIAAIREVFEETGLLLGHKEGLAPRTLEEGRRSLLASETTFFEWVASRKLRLSIDVFVPWAHWITPEVEARRFDTWFFVATAPPGQSAAILVGEALEGDWLTVDAALAAVEARTIFLAPPTLRTLEELSRARTIADVSEATRSRRLTTVMPFRLPGTEPPTLVIPGDAAHATPGPAGVDGPSRFVLDGGRWTSVEGPPR